MIARVAAENALYSFDKLFSYEIPDELSDKIRAGMRVVVPFGKGSKKRVGLVFEVGEPEENARLKPISAVIDDEPIISDELLRLCKWLKENTFCTYFDAFRSILPAGLSYSLKHRFELNKNVPEDTLTAEEKSLAKALEAAGKSELETLYAENKAKINELLKREILTEIEIPQRRVGDEVNVMVRVCEDFDETQKLTPKQKAAVEFVRENGSASIKEVCYACAATSAVVNRLIEKGILERFENVVFRLNSDVSATESPDDIILSPKQSEVFGGISALMTGEKPECALLRGITGSGKTSIFIKLIDKAVKAGKGAIMLVPEISLTPQMVGKFQRLFGSEVAILHSSLSVGERADEYRRIKSGLARIVIGTRSAVFAPVQNLAIIVIDEEGEGTYKSENSPRYHARDVAKQRCFAQKSLLLLASATPSLESYYFAKTGRYKLFEMDERFNNAVLPEVEIVDMQQERQNGNMSTFSAILAEHIEHNLSRGEQSILLLNRRGYRTGVRCAMCGKPMECPNCSVPLTYHKANGCLMCHCCGYFRRFDSVCTYCGGKFFGMKGEGTQLIEDELSELFPKARILRMDADTTSGKTAFERRFKAFADGEYDIMVGTQMIAKGLNFPNVTLVGVLKTDNSLYAQDFRAYERTFSLITQVAGRSGRGDKRGRAIIQTFSPEHYVINLAAKQDYPSFYNEEIQLREAVFYPPFCDIVTFVFSAVNESECQKCARKFADMLLKTAKEYGNRVPMRVLGPAACAVGRVNGRYRFSLMAKCKNSASLRETVDKTMKAALADADFANVRFFADINGSFAT